MSERVVGYGFQNYAQLFTPRQLVALTTFSELVGEARKRIHQDALVAGCIDDGQGLASGGAGSTAYAEAVSVYLAFTLDRLLQQCSTLSVWSNNPAHELVVNAFGRQALSMTWDYGEVNPFCGASSWEKVLSFLIKALDGMSTTST